MSRCALVLSSGNKGSMTEPTDDQKRLAKVAVLVEKIRVNQAQGYALFEELNALCKSEPTSKDITRQVVAAFCEAWRAKYHDTCVVNGKDAAGLARVLKALGMVETLARIARYLGDVDPFVCGTRHSPALFCNQINKWGRPLEAFARPANCLHSPTCANDSQHTRRVQQELRGEAH